MDNWNCEEDKIEFVKPGKKERRKIFKQKVKDSFKRIVSIFLTVIGLAIIVLIFIAYHNQPKETTIDKMKSELEIQLDRLQADKVNR